MMKKSKIVVWCGSIGPYVRTAVVSFVVDGRRGGGAEALCDAGPPADGFGSNGRRLV